MCDPARPSLLRGSRCGGVQLQREGGRVTWIGIALRHCGGERICPGHHPIRVGLAHVHVAVALSPAQHVSLELEDSSAARDSGLRADYRAGKGPRMNTTFARRGLLASAGLLAAATPG